MKKSRIPSHTKAMQGAVSHLAREIKPCSCKCVVEIHLQAHATVCEDETSQGENCDEATAAKWMRQAHSYHYLQPTHNFHHEPCQCASLPAAVTQAFLGDTCRKLQFFLSWGRIFPECQQWDSWWWDHGEFVESVDAGDSRGPQPQWSLNRQ